MKSALTLGVLSALLSLPASAAIFGADNRMPVLPNTPFKEVQRATAVGVIWSLLNEEPNGKISVAAEIDGGYCPEERLQNLPSIAYGCTAFLIGPDLLLTAGHCSVNVGVVEHETETYCKTYRWMFDYAPDANGKTKTSGIDADKIYNCKETIFAASEEHAPYRDFAIIRLDRKVEGRTPLKLNFDPVKPQEVLSVVGYPFGTPATVSTNGRVLRNDPAFQKIVTTLDVFEGNSGSPVLNARKEVVGILVGGFPSANTFKDEKRSCRRRNRCDDNGLNCLAPDTDFTPFPYYQVTGSEVQRLDSMREILKNLP